MMRRTITFTVICALFFLGRSAGAAGFRLVETDNAGQGQGHAMVAGVTDAASVYYNPAAMAELEKYGAKVGFQFIDPKSYRSHSSGEFQTENETFSIPHLYTVKKLQDMGIAVGLGVFSNFGTGTNWNWHTPMRYEATDSKLRTTTVNLAGAMSLGIVSLGVGVDYLTAKVTYDNLIPFGGGAADGISNLNGSGSTIGFNAGLLIKATDAIKIGASYRSAMSPKLKGTIDLQNFPSAMLPALQAKGVSGDDYSSDAEATLKLPAMISAGININITDAVSLEVDADMTQWSSFDTLELTFSKPLSVGSSTILPASQSKSQKWKDTVTLKAGAAFKYNPNLVLRAGYYIDPTPVPDETFSPRVPDADRNSATLGFTYTADDKYYVDAAFTYVMVAKRNVDNNVGAPGTVDGEYKTNANVFGVSVGYKF